jgi:chloramphenicol 3-O phosphotransferase
MENGLIILLNGTSSSGKTTLAKALQMELAEPYMYISLDEFFHLYPEKYFSPTNQAEAALLARLIPAVVSGFHRSAACLARSGNNLIVDHVLQESEWLKEIVENWAGLDVLFVGVKCPLEVSEQRERERGDRDPGIARYQFERVHAHGLYDIEVDTSTLSVNECVSKITALIDHRPAKQAFQELAARLLGQESEIENANR